MSLSVYRRCRPGLSYWAPMPYRRFQVRSVDGATPRRRATVPTLKPTSYLMTCPVLRVRRPAEAAAGLAEADPRKAIQPGHRQLDNPGRGWPGAPVRGRGSPASGPERAVGYAQATD
jgi:hypothetical protein